MLSRENVQSTDDESKLKAMDVTTDARQTRSSMQWTSNQVNLKAEGLRALNAKATRRLIIVRKKRGDQVTSDTMQVMKLKTINAFLIGTILL